MRKRLSDKQIDDLKEAIIAAERAGWNDDLDVLWDLREKIEMFSRLSSNTVDQHEFLFAQGREQNTLTTYILMAMDRAIKELEMNGPSHGD